MSDLCEICGGKKGGCAFCKFTTGGRPRKEIDFKLLDNLLEIQCTQDEVCAVLDVDSNTLDAKVRESFQMGFSEYSKSKSDQGKMSLRRRQWMKAQQDDNTMLIWLGKQYLSQSDKQEQKQYIQGEVSLYRKLTQEEQSLIDAVSQNTVKQLACHRDGEES